MLAPIRALADLIINTSKFNVHELRELHPARNSAASATSRRS